MTDGGNVPEIAYTEGGAGAPLLLVHGIPGQAEIWNPVREELRADPYRVVVPDLLGFGKSPAAADVYVEAQADALARLLARLGIDVFHLAAHDFGVPVALTLLRRHRSLRASSLVVAATNLFPDTPIPAPLRLAKVPALRWMLWPMLGTVPGAALTRWAGSGHGSRRNAYALSFRSARSTFRIFVRSLASLESIYGPIEAFARTLDVPATVVWGTKDPFFSVDVGRRTADALRCPLVVLDGVGHFVPEEAPQAVAAAIRETAARAAR